MLRLDENKLPRELRERPAPLLEEQNALPLWAKAIERLRWNDFLECEEFTDEHKRSLVADNEGVIEWIDAGIARGRAKFLVRNADGKPVSGSFFSYCKLKDLLIYRCQLSIAAGDFEAALRETDRLIGMGKAILQGPNRVVDTFLGMGCICACLGLVLRLSDQGAVPEMLADSFLRHIRALPSIRSCFAAAARTDYWEDELESIKSLSACSTLDGLVAEMLPHAEQCDEHTDVKGRQSWERSWRECQRKRDAILQMLQGHTQPFDAEQTAYWFADCVGRDIRSVLAPFPRNRWWKLSDHFRRWEHQVYDWRFRRNFDVWPKEVLSPNWLEMMESDDEKEQFAGAVALLSNPKMARNGTRVELRQARERIQQLTNPIGRYFCLMYDRSCSSFHAMSALRFDTEPQIVATVIGLRRYEARHGELPKRLEDVVSDDLPRSLLIDPWTGCPLRYYRDYGLVMSAGRDFVPQVFEDHPWRTQVAWQMKPYFDEMALADQECVVT